MKDEGGNYVVNVVIMFFLAALPILWLVIALSGLKMPGYWACPIALLMAGILAALVWHMDTIPLLTAGLEGIIMALWPISLVIIAAIFTYNLCLHTGAMEVIKGMLTTVSNDKRILVLMVAWGFGGFMEGMAGFGTAVAIPASMLCGLGFEPIFSALVCLIANAAPTAFGSIGIPTITVSNITGLDSMEVAFATTVQLAPIVILTPFLLVMLTGKSVKALKGVWHITLASGLAFILPQMLAAKYMGAELPNILGSICAMAVTIFLSKINKKETPSEYLINTSKQSKEPKITWKKAGKAWSPFLLIFAFLVLTSKLIPVIHYNMAKISTSIVIYQGEGGMPTTFYWIMTPGILILIAAIIGAKIQGASGKEIGTVFASSLKQMWKTVLTIASIMAAAKIMSYSGMISEIAALFVGITGSYYPLIAPFIGSIGTFVTGSATSAGVLFGGLQQQTAQTLGINEVWLAAANTVGADAGKIISPQSIAIAIAAINQPGVESKIMSKAVKYYLLFVGLMGAICYIGLQIFF